MTAKPTPSSDATEGPAPQRRLRLVEVERERVGEFRCRARVALESPSGAVHEAHSEMALNDRNLIAVVCEATLGAIAEFLGEPADDLRLIAVRSLRVFDTPVVAVQLAAPAADGERLLLGIAVADDQPWGSARAVLHATNRLVGNVIDR